MTMIPLVDILMATYNGERYVAEQIASLQLQTFEDWRLLVSDDCSDDDTLSIVKRIAKGDSRICIVSENMRRGGAKENFMWLLGQVDAPYVMFCDQDDVWLPEKIEWMLGRLKEMERDYGVGLPLLAFSDMAVVDETLGLISESFERYSNLNPWRDGFPQVLAQAVGAGCTYIMNRQLAELACECVRIDDAIMHDWWVAAVAAAFGRLGFVDKRLVLYRQHGDNSIGAIDFKPSAWFGRVGDMAERQEAIAVQAGCMADTYGRRLGSDNLHIACECAETCDGTRGEKMTHLLKSGAWKAGVRKLGQILAAMRRGGVLRSDNA